MDYLRRAVSLRAYGQRDPLIEYRREGLGRFRAMEESIANAIREAIPRIRPADDARIRAEEERTRKALAAASTEGGVVPEQAPIVKAAGYGRNDTVTIKSGDKTQTMKYKKAEPFINEGWTIVS